MSPTPDSPEPLRSAPAPLRSSGALRPHSGATPERSGAHQYCRSDAPNPTDTCGFSIILCFPHLRSAPAPLIIVNTVLQKTPLFNTLYR